MKAEAVEELAANSVDPQAARVVVVAAPHGRLVAAEIVEAAVAEHRPKWAFMAHWETDWDRVYDFEGL